MDFKSTHIRILNVYSYVFMLVMVLLSVSTASAAPGTFIYQGQITKPDGTSLESAAVTFTIEIYSPDAAECALYEEQHIINMTGSEGVFSLNIGNGVQSGGGFEDSSVVEQIFANLGTYSGLTCASGTTYTPGPNDRRKLRLTYNDGSGPVTIASDHNIQSVPFAWSANDLRGLAPTDFVQINAGQNVTQANIEAIYGGTGFTELSALVGGTSSLYVQPNGSNFVPTSTISFNNQAISNVVDPTNAQDASTKNYSDTNIGGDSADTTGVGPATGDGLVLTWNQTNNRWEAQAASATDATKLPLAGGTMSGDINMGGNQVLATGHMTMSAQSTITVGAYDNAQQTTLIGSLLPANEGAMWYNSDTNAVMYWNGSAAQVVGVGAGGDILDGGNTEAAAVTIGTNDAFALNLETNNSTAMTIDTSGNVGVGTNNPGQKLDVEGSILSGPKGTSTGDGGAILFEELAANGTNSVGFRAPDVLAADVLWQLPNADGTSGQVLQTNGSGVLTWATAGGSGDILDGGNTEGAAVTLGTNDAFALNLETNNSTAVTINTSGNVGVGTTAPGQKLDVEGSILSGPKGTSAGDGGAILFEELAVNGTNSVGFRAPDALASDILWQLPAADGTSGQVLQTNGSGVLTWATVSGGGSGDILDGGNTEGAAVTIGTNDAFTLNLETNNTTAMTILSSGDVGIGSGSPSSALDVNGVVRSSQIQINKTSSAAAKLEIESTSASTTGTGILVDGLSGADGRANVHIDTNETNSARLALRVTGSNASAEGLAVTATGTVGVGTTSPGQKLDIEGSILSGPKGTSAGDGGAILFEELAASGTNSVGFRAPDTIATSVLWQLPNADGTSGQVLQTNGSGVLTWATASGGTGDILDGGNTEGAAVTIGTNDAFALNLETNNATAMTIDTSGNIGIGTTTPLDYGAGYVTLQLNGSTASTGGVIRSSSSDNTQIMKMFMDGGFAKIGTETSHAVRILTGDTAAAGFETNSNFWANGNIGAGDNTPEAHLEVSANGTTGGSLLMLSSNDANDGDIMTVLESGNVGIGTATPGQKLDVEGSILSGPKGTSAGDGGAILFEELAANGTNSVGFRAPDVLAADVLWQLPNADGTSGQVLQTNGSGVLTWATAIGGAGDILDGGNTEAAAVTIGTNDAFALNFETNNATAMTIDSVGHIGIGTAAPTSTSHIYENNAGVGTSNGLTIEQDGTGDAVAQFLLSSTQRWVAGIDNSDGDRFKIASSTDLDTNAALTIETGGNIGIGTNSPASRLDIVQSGAAAGLTVRNGTNPSIQATDGTITTKLQVVGTGGLVGTESNHNFDIRTNNVARVTVNTLGNVGIGTAGPGAKLDVEGASGSNFWTTALWGRGIELDNANAIKWEDNGTTRWGLGATSTGFHFIQSDADNTSLAPNYPLYLSNSGDIGVGTITPGQKLDVEGSILSGPKGTSAGDGGAILFEELAANGTNSIGFRAPDTIASDVLWQLPNADGTSGQVLQTNGSGVLSWATAGGGSGDILDGGNTEGAAVTIGTNDAFALNLETNNSTAMTIDTSGNVGIGSTTPGGVLDVAGNVAISGVQRITSGGSYRAPATDTAGIVGLGWSGDGDTGLFNPGADLLAVSTGGVERLRVDASGNVGIGTDSPVTQLQVNSEISNDNARVYDTDAVMIAHQTPTSNTALNDPEEVLYLVREGTSSEAFGAMATMKLSRYENSGANSRTRFDIDLTHSSFDDVNVMTLLSSGRVGIGTSAPDVALDIDTGVINAAQICDENNSNCFDLSGSLGDVNQGGNSFAAPMVLGTNDSNSLSLETNGATAVTIDTSGNVGVGTSSPATALQVNSEISNDNSRAYDANAMMITHPTPTSDTSLNDPEEVLYLVREGTSGQAFGAMATMKLSRYENSAASSRTRFDIDLTDGSFADANVMTLLSSGAVGIGTDAPTQQLDVEGSIVSGPKGTSAGDGGAILFEELAANGTNSVGFRAPDVLAADVLWQLPNADGTSGQVLQTNGSGVLTWATAGGGSGDILDGGNTEGAAVTIGTNDAFALNLETNNTTAMTIDTSGNIGVGITNPSRRLDVRITSSTAVANFESTGGALVDIAAGAGGDAGIRFDGDTDWTFGVDTSDSGVLKFDNNLGFLGSNTRMALTTGGSLGVGTSTPSSQLDVVGTAPIITVRESGGTAGGIHFGNSGHGIKRNYNSVTNDVGFYTTSGRLHLSTNGENDGELVVTSSGDVGIGTAAPATSLHITNAGVSGKTFSNNTGLIIENNGSSSSSFAMQVSTAGSNDLLSITNAGRVGIGTTSPANLLDVGGSGPKMSVSHSGSVGLQLTDWTDGNQYIDFDGHLYFRDGIDGAGNTSPLTLLSSGNVGVGTATPAQKLDVEGSILSGPKGTSAGDGGAILFEELAANGTNSVGFRAPDTIVSDVLWQLPAADGTSGQVLQTNGSGVLTWATAAGGSGDILDGGNTEGAAVTIGTNDAFALNLETNNTTAMTIDSSGNVGIGTITPGVELELLTGTGAEGDPTYVASQYFSVRANSASSMNTSMTVIAGSVGDSAYHFGDKDDADVGGLIYDHADDTFDIKVGGAQRFHIDSGFNVGIGTTSVSNTVSGSRALEIQSVHNGSPELLLNTYSNGTPTLSFASQGVQTAYIRTIQSAADKDGDIAFGTNITTTVTERMRLMSTGELGLGESSPEAHLEISADGTTGGSVLMVSSNDNNDGDLLNVLESGDIGIGTNSPTQKLDVEGTMLSGPKGTSAGDGGAILFEELAVNGTNSVGFRAPDTVASDVLWQLPAADGTSGQVLQTNGSGVLTWATAGGGSGDILDGGNTEGAAVTIGTNDAFALNLETNSSTAMTIDSSGNVGIGTSSPESTLNVIGVSTFEGASSQVILRESDASDSSDGWHLSMNNEQLQFIHEDNSAGPLYSVPMVMLPGGNVGIGTTNPSQTLHVEGSTGAVETRISNTGSGASDYAGVGLKNDNGMMSFFWTGSSGYSQAANQDKVILEATSISSGLRLVASGSNTIEFVTEGNLTNPEMIITDSGNVAIGTTTPGQKLDVEGTMLSGPKGTSAGDGGAILFEELAANGTNSVGFRAPDTIASDVLWQLPAADGTSGQVLQTNGSGVLTWATAAGGSGDILDGGNTEGAAVTIGTNDAFALNLETNNSTAMTITSAGNIGIGTTTPDSPLDVRSASNPAVDVTYTRASGGIALRTVSTDTGAGEIQLRYNSAGAPYVVSNSGAGSAAFLEVQEAGSSKLRLGQTFTGGQSITAESNLQVAFDSDNNGAGAFEIVKGSKNGRLGFDGTPLLRIQNSGDVGIGTSTPSAKLHVNGDIRVDTVATSGTAGLCRDGTNKITDCSSAPGDLAEWYETDGSVEPGNIVSMTLNEIEYEYEVIDAKSGFETGQKRKTSASILSLATSSEISLGVVATSPWRTMGESILEKAKHPEAIALKGRVPVKFLNENGEVKPGDPLAISSQPGVAAKAIKSGFIIGFALEASTKGKKEIEVFLAPQHWSPHGLSVTQSGNVGIGTTAPAHNLHVIGTAGLSTGTAWTNTSDRRLKDIRGDYEHGLEEILNLRTIRFNYKKDNALGLPSDKGIVGFVAQEVQEVIPEAVFEREDGYLELNVDPIHWATVNAVQELHGMCQMTQEQQLKVQEQLKVIAENDKKQDRELASLKTENKKQADKIRSLEERLERLEKALLKKAE